jgi:hypothetical protein
MTSELRPSPATPTKVQNVSAFVPSDHFDPDSLSGSFDHMVVPQVLDWEEDEFCTTKADLYPNDYVDRELLGEVESAEADFIRQTKSAVLKEQLDELFERLSAVGTVEVDQEIPDQVVEEWGLEPEFDDEEDWIAPLPIESNQTNGVNASNGHYPAGSINPRTGLPSTCPRCRGAMIIERDWYGAYATCICCGYVQEAVSRPPIDLLDEEENGPRQRRRQPSHGKLRL